MTQVSAGPKDVVELEVLRDRDPVGKLQRTKHGARFRYHGAYAQAHGGDRRHPIAFRMPVREEPYDVRGVNLHPFFAGLLPEGLRLRALVRGVKTSEDDLFSLLAATGEDTVGDVWVRSPDSAGRTCGPFVEAAELAETTFEELLARSLDWSSSGDRVSIQGVQPKVSAGRLAVPLRGKRGPEHYILKLGSPDHPRLLENEAFFMGLARSMRIKTAELRVVQDRGGEAGLLVRRFDRQATATGDTSRIHQEDACQLLDRYPQDKYRLSLREIAQALDVCSAPVVERLRLLQLQALSYLIGNGDLHGKNISVQVVEGRVSLTPIYDLLSTLPYGDRHLALKVEGRDQDLDRRHFVAFGARIGLRERAVERMLDGLVRGVGGCVGRLGEIGLDERRTRHLERSISERLEALGT